MPKAIVTRVIPAQSLVRVTNPPAFIRAATASYQKPPMVAVQVRHPEMPAVSINVELTADTPLEAWEQLHRGLNEVLAWLEPTYPGAPVSAEAWELRVLPLEA